MVPHPARVEFSFPLFSFSLHFPSLWFFTLLYQITWKKVRCKTIQQYLRLTLHSYSVLSQFVFLTLNLAAFLYDVTMLWRFLSNNKLKLFSEASRWSTAYGLLCSPLLWFVTWPVMECLTLQPWEDTEIEDPTATGSAERLKQESTQEKQHWVWFQDVLNLEYGA